MVKGALGPNRGLRPFDPVRDVGPLANLLEVAFGERLEAEGREAVWGMRMAACFGPLLWFLARFGGLFSGYVWVEEGKVVGNATISRSGKGYLISNLAVHPRYQRRGIARRLIDRAVEEAGKRGGEWIALEVRRDNVAAKGLYEKLEFVEVDALSEMWLEEVPEGEFVSPEGFKLRDLEPHEWPQVYRLWRAALPQEASWLGRRVGGWLPSGPPGRLARLASLVGWERRYNWVVEDRGEVVAILFLLALRYGSPHRWEMVVHPRWRGQVEEALVAKSLATLSAYPKRGVRVRLYPSYPEVREILERHGFSEIRTLERMMLKL